MPPPLDEDLAELSRYLQDWKLCMVRVNSFEDGSRYDLEAFESIIDNSETLKLLKAWKG